MPFSFTININKGLAGENHLLQGSLQFQHTSQKNLGLLESPTYRPWDLQLYHQQKEKRKQIPAIYIFLPVFLNQLQYLKGHLLMWNSPETRDREEDTQRTLLLGPRDVDFSVACSCSFWSQNSVSTGVISNARRCTIAEHQQWGVPVTNPSAQKGQLPRSNVHLAQLSNYCTETSVSTALICHESLVPMSPKYTSGSPSSRLHTPLPSREVGTWCVDRERGYQGPTSDWLSRRSQLGGKHLPQKGRAMEAILKES